MKPIRNFPDSLISPSRLDEFLQFQSGSDFKGDEYPLEVYINKLLKIESPKGYHKANAGTAGHYCLENGGYGIIGNKYNVPVENELWTVLFDLDAEVQLPVIRESWVRGIFCGCNVVGKVDALDAVAIHDHKFTSQVDIDKYMSSMQWKLYLLMSGREQFIYNLFTVKVEDDNIVTVKDFQRLVLPAYQGMREEVEKVIADYRDFLLDIKPMLEARISEYNGLIDREIARLTDSPLVTVKDALIDVLNNKRIKEL